MEFELYKHNAEAAKSILNNLEIYNSVLYTAPTGSGKTFVGLSVLKHYMNIIDDFSCVIMAPSIQLIRQWKDIIEKYLPDLQFNIFTYTNLNPNLLSTDKIDDICKSDIIIYEEAHHMYAEKWYKSIQKIHSRNTSIKILGITATPIRSDGKNVSDMFDITISGIGFSDFIQNSVINSVTYVSSMYIPESDYSEYRDNLYNKTARSGKKDTLDLFDKLDIMNSKETIKNIITKYLRDGLNKIIVFNKNVEDLETNKVLFHNLFPDASIYSMSYIKSRNENIKEKDRFEDDTNKISFLFSVNMLNEGVHSINITACIMLRKTMSHIIYLQQLGRVLSSSSNGNVVIYDFVANHNISIPTINSEGCIKEIFDKCNTGHIKINNVIYMDYCKDFLSIVNKICDFWSDEDINYLVSNYKKINITEISSHLNKSISAIYRKLNSLGMEVYAKKKWTKEECDLLEKYPNNLNYLCELLPDRTYAAIQKRLKTHIGTDNARCEWTEDEDNILRKYYPIEGSAVYKRFKRHTKSSTSRRANKLGLTFNRWFEWSQHDIDIVKELYPSIGYRVLDLISPGITKKMLYHKAKTLGLNIENNDEEINEMIKKYYPTEGQSMYRRIGLSKSATTSRAKKLGVEYNGSYKPWTEEENEILIKNFPTMGSKVAELLPGRNPKSIGNRARSLGVYAGFEFHKYTEEEDEIIKKYYPDEGVNGIMKRLVGRSKSSIYYRANTLNVKSKAKKKRD